MQKNQPDIAGLLTSVKKMESQIALALPKHLDADRFCRILVTAFRQTPRLAECDKTSVLACAMLAAQLGLEPNGPLGQAFLIPYGGVCTFQFGFKGLLEIVRRSGEVRHVSAQVVYSGDEFEYAEGLSPILEHRPKLEGERGTMRLAYAVALLKSGDRVFEVVPKDRIERIKKRALSKMKNSAGSPWAGPDEPEMWRKTAVKALCKYLPLSMEDQRIVAQDETTHTKIAPNLTEDEGEAIHDVEAREVADESQVKAFWAMCLSEKILEIIEKNADLLDEIKGGATMDRLTEIRAQAIATRDAEKAPAPAAQAPAPIPKAGKNAAEFAAKTQPPQGDEPW